MDGGPSPETRIFFKGMICSVEGLQSLNRHVGNLEGISFTWDCGRWSKEGSGNGVSFSTGGLRGGTSRLGFFTCDTEGYKEENSGDGLVWILESSRDCGYGAESQKCQMIMTSYVNKYGGYAH